MSAANGVTRSRTRYVIGDEGRAKPLPKNLPVMISARIASDFLLRAVFIIIRNFIWPSVFYAKEKIAIYPEQKFYYFDVRS